ncbi:MAG: ferrous iron transport protein B [Myxococcota bacterium]|jgi:ferrous iron transport protein B|nr:ferrous iron transport protein B [Myxococcota bacterium]
MSEPAQVLEGAATQTPQRQRLVALAGNPNVGKTTVFNRLTRLHHKVGNYPGVTVERKSGFVADCDGVPIEIVDVPGTYSLNPRSLDEEVAYRVLIGAIEGSRPPDLVVCLVDASNLERNLYLASQVLDLGRPTVIALNMVDAADGAGIEVDANMLSEELGVPVVPLVASRGDGIEALRAAISGPLPIPVRRRWQLDAAVEREVNDLARRLEHDLPALSAQQRFSDALRALTQRGADFFEVHHTPGFWTQVRAVRAQLENEGVSSEQAEVVGRYDWITPLAARVSRRVSQPGPTASDKIDRLLTHRVAGPILFFVILALVFQSVFTWAAPFMDAIDNATVAAGDWLGASLPEGPVRDLLVDGVVAGVGSVVIFLPQILILFFFLGLLEDTGYMARAAFIMDRIMKRVGLSGRSVVPLVSGFACAIPGIMAARTIENQRDRLVTIMVTPLMTCSARLPVYALLIAAFIPAGHAFGFLSYQGLTLLALYLLGVVFAVAAAWLLKRFVVQGNQSVFVMELPPYRMPRLRDVVWRMLERGRLFLRRAGTIIFAAAVVLWFLATYPQVEPSVAIETRHAELSELQASASDARVREEIAAQLAQIEDERAGYALSQSAMGKMGRFLEPAITPLGYDWKIGVALVASLAAREVAVGALGTIYSVQDADETSMSLIDRMRADVDPDTGRPTWTPLVAASLMVFFVFACQCLATVAVVKRETDSWRWALFLFGYMSALAWGAAFVTYQGGRLLGLT